MMLSTDMFVLSKMVGSASSLFLVTWSAKAVGIDVKRDTTSKDTIISCRVMLQTETFSTKSQLFVTVYLLFCKGLRIEARCLDTW